jgi:hypothetical protein
MAELRAVRLLLPIALLLSCAARGAVQPNPYTADQIERLLRGGVHPDRILADARRECIAFRVDDAIAARFARAGAPPSFVQALGGACQHAVAGR